MALQVVLCETDLVLDVTLCSLRRIDGSISHRTAGVQANCACA